MKTTSHNDWPLWTPREGTASAFDLTDGPRRSLVARPQRRLITESSLPLASHFGWAQWLELLDLIAAPASAEVEVPETEDFYFDWIDPDSLEALPPLSSQDVVLHFENQVTNGEFAPVEVDDLDLELFD